MTSGNQKGIASYLKPSCPLTSKSKLGLDEKSSSIGIVGVPGLKIPRAAKLICGKVAGSSDVMYRSAGFHLPAFLDFHRSEHIFATLERDLDWSQGEHTIETPRGAVPSPRQSLFFSDSPPVRDSSSSSSYDTKGISQWHPLLEELRDELERQLGWRANCVLVNRYAHGRHHIGWHSDREAIAGANSVIVSLSFGAVRRFSLRDSPYSRQRRPRHQEKWKTKIDLTPGSLFIMAGEFQSHFQHRINPTKNPTAGLRARINLTFRQNC